MKCARCTHVWVQGPGGVIPAKAAQPAQALIVDERPAEQRPETPPEMIWAGTDIPHRRPSMAAYWAVAAASVAVLFAASLAFRDSIAAAAPFMGKVYAAIGMPVDVSGLELTIEAKSMASATQGGASTLVVTGVIANVTSEERPVPRIEATLLAKDKRELHTWSFDAGVTSLKPGETHSFQQELAQPPGETYQVYAHFADGEG